ncbi:sensor histidine kinase [Cohnella sp. GCM10012308]|uniref:sensor histidine kinase n=1 Tax=Cohnella sp. GCM10012308 TaxID=3317329 RepID=UPI00360F9D97
MAFLRRLSIRSQLFILAGSAILVILVIILHTYTTMSGMITRNHEAYVKQTIAEIKKNVASNRDVLFRLMQTISYNADVQSFLVEKNELRRYEMFKEISRLLTSQRELKDGILDIVVSGDNGASIDINGGSRYVAEMNGQLPDKSNAYYVDMRQFGTLYGSGQGLVFATTIYYVQQGELFNTRVGTLYFIVDPASLAGEQDYTLKQTNTQIYLLDRSYKIIASNTERETGSGLSELTGSLKQDGIQSLKWQGKQYVVQTESLPGVDAVILSAAPKDALLRELLDIRKQELIILSIGLLVLAIPLMFIVNNILRPLKKMIFFMTTAASGDSLKFRKRISLKGYMEISIMAAAFNDMLDEIEHLTQRLLETNARLYGTELERKKSELAFLRSQINPHFLYNTLEAITGIAAVNGQGSIKTMTRALSSIFRYSVKGADAVPLSEEIRIVEAYVRIQQIRFADRFTVRYRIAEAASERVVPKMILQPLVENAIYHGVEPTLRHCVLEIAGEIDESGDLVVDVRDDGVGMPPERLEELRRVLQGPVSGPEEADELRSIGLVNVNNRLALTFGQQSGLSIDSSPERGTHIRLRFARERRDSDA